jgi:hypothetical protein
MSDAIISAGGLAIVAYVLWQIFGRAKSQQQDARVLDLTTKINENKEKLIVTKKEADASLEAYEAAKKKYDNTPK